MSSESERARAPERGGCAARWESTADVAYRNPSQAQGASPLVGHGGGITIGSAPECWRVDQRASRHGCVVSVGERQSAHSRDSSFERLNICDCGACM